MTQREMEQPAIICRGGHRKPERCAPGYTLPHGTVVYSNRQQWAAACAGRPTDKAFPYITRNWNLLYAILP